MEANVQEEKDFIESIYEPYREKSEIDLRTHLALIESHLVWFLRSGEMSWEEGFRGYLASKFPY